MLEISVRYIPTMHERLDGQLLPTGIKPALCLRNQATAFGVINGEESISLIDLDLHEHDTSPKVTYHGTDYPPELFIQHMQRISQGKTIEPRAKRILSEYPNILEDAPTPPSKPTHSKKKKETSAPPNVIATIATELKTTPQKVRKFLRSQGMKAPYSDEKQIRKLTKKGIDQ